jgi:signal transduction histidine kinase
MTMENVRRRTLMSWASAGFLAVLCLALAVLQYRWIGEISRAEEIRLRAGLRESLDRLSRDFNSEITTLFAELSAPASLIQQEGREEAYGSRFGSWRENARHPELLKAEALAIPDNGALTLRMLDFDRREFRTAEWPSSWSGMRERLMGRLDGRFAPPIDRGGMLMEMPRFGARRGEGPPVEQEWLIIELDPTYVRNTLIPQLVQRHLQSDAYSVVVFPREDPSQIMYRSSPGVTPLPEGKADMSVNLMDPQWPGIERRGKGGFGRGRGKGGPPGGNPGGPPGGRGSWTMQVQYNAGSLETFVASVRWRNLGVSAFILLLILATTVLLVRSVKEQERLAEMQLNFVAGVSHELRTPLTVIRTAAYNLRGRVASNPAHVERYGKLIQEESTKLEALVEQVLRFAGTRAGSVIRRKEPVAVEQVIDQALRSARLETSAIQVDKNVEENLPRILGDELALQHAVQNLVDNAVKYGTEQSPWIGVKARRVDGPDGAAVEVCVADKGPGIPAAEQGGIFDPFVRGKRAIQDQIHGTGLGLNLVKKIVEAHGGTIRLRSEPMQRTEFIITIPAAPEEQQNEFANSPH